MIRVSFTLICGESEEREISRDVQSDELHDIAGQAFGGTRDWVTLVIGSKILPRSFGNISCKPPLARLTCDELNIVTLWNPESFFSTLRARNWNSALDSLQSTSRPYLFAGARDSSGDTCLSWAAYLAAKDPCPDAYKFVHLVLDMVPTDISHRGSISGMLPLHDAAWANAPLDLAMMLCRAHPQAAMTLTSSGETPYAVGKYYHGARFAWPGPLLMQAQAVALNRGEPLPDHTEILPPARERETVQQLPFQGAGFNSDQQTRRKSNTESNQVSVTTAAANSTRTAVYRRRRFVRHTRREKSQDDVAMHAVDEVQFMREARVRESGAYAGASRVRNCRCNFTELAKVMVSHSVHYLKTSSARTVQKEVQRLAGKPKWPSKKTLQKERNADRCIKIEELEL